ncbi:MAG: hypothetical protein OQK76_11555 [Gammaproteobacteria bacterium]|nr:hypothetical protein [Gammaproteobacteria bacterium]
MQRSNCQILEELLVLYRADPALALLLDKLDNLFSENEITPELDDVVSIYNESIPLIEVQMWGSLIDDERIDLYQKLFREYEDHISVRSNDSRHDIVVVIPVADRPQHLSDCLDSLLYLCRAYGYGGMCEGRYKKISVLVADDSKEGSNIESIKSVVKSFNDQGLDCMYFGQQEQLRLLDEVTGYDKSKLAPVIGNNDASSFYHKGASITRNISYLRLHQLNKSADKVIYYFIDSDQEFRINMGSSAVDKELYAINYFYYLDRIFAQNNIKVLTGKVVGDPPVSPAVMAGRFLDDVIHFLSQISKFDENQECQFHNDDLSNLDDASYHDMAELFGFTNESKSYPYHCSISGSHNHLACLNDFADKLNHFFDGEHPTRKTYYDYENPVSSIKSARTVYSGNYAIKPEALEYFIPFAGLKLRMAGPVLGRIIRSEIGSQFASANLPMLHKRTVQDTGQSEFRPGIKKNSNRVDLSGEFERQFFGDVMLFTIEKLTESGYPDINVSEDQINKTLNSVGQEIYQKYLERQSLIQHKLKTLKQIFENMDNWWNQSSVDQISIASFCDFINNIENNFGTNSEVYKMIDSAEHRNNRYKEMLDSIMSYSESRSIWQRLLNGVKN